MITNSDSLAISLWIIRYSFVIGMTGMSLLNTNQRLFVNVMQRPASRQPAQSLPRMRLTLLVPSSALHIREDYILHPSFRNFDYCIYTCAIEEGSAFRHRPSFMEEGFDTSFLSHNLLWSVV
jgi:hypothetical protein